MTVSRSTTLWQKYTPSQCGKTGPVRERKSNVIGNRYVLEPLDSSESSHCMTLEVNMCECVYRRYMRSETVKATTISPGICISRTLLLSWQQHLHPGCRDSGSCRNAYIDSIYFHAWHIADESARSRCQKMKSSLRVNYIPRHHHIVHIDRSIVNQHVQSFSLYIFLFQLDHLGRMIRRICILSWLVIPNYTSNQQSTFEKMFECVQFQAYRTLRS